MVLFLITDSFPYGYGEAFLEAEIPYLKESFDKIYIITTRREDRPSRSNFTFDGGSIVVDRCRVDQDDMKHNPWKLVLGIRFLFSRLFLNEVKILLQSSSFKMFFLRLRSAFLSTVVAESIYQRMTRHLLRENIESSKICIYSYWMRNGALAAAKIKKRYPKICFMSRAHGVDLYSERSSINHIPFQKQIITLVDKVFLISEHGQKYLTDKFSFAQSKFEISRLGTLDQGIATYVVSDSILRIVSCSAMVPVKRIHLLVDALSQIKKTKIIWTHIGDGPDKDWIVELINSKLDSQQIRVRLVGQLSNDEVLSFYRNESVDCLINVSESEGLPVSMMEAMSFGIPVLATNVGGVSEIVDETTGVLMRADSTAATIVEDILRFHNLSLLQKKLLRVNSRTRWKSTYNSQSNYTDFVNRILVLVNQIT